MEADLIISADGVHTTSRRYIAGDETKARESGFSVYRVSYPAELALENSLVAKKWAIAEGGNDVNRFFVAKDLHAIVMMSSKTCIWFLTHRVCIPCLCHGLHLLTATGQERDG